MLEGETMDIYFDNVKAFKKAYPNLIKCKHLHYAKKAIYLDYTFDDFKQIDGSKLFETELKQTLINDTHFEDYLFALPVDIPELGYCIYLDINMEKVYVREPKTEKAIAYYLKPIAVRYRKYKYNMYGIISPQSTPFEEGNFNIK